MNKDGIIYGDSPDEEECNCENCQDSRMPIMDLPQNVEEIFGGMIALPLATVQDTDYDAEEFKKGVAENSYLAGCVTALTNTGVPALEALTYFMNMKIAEINMKMNKDKCKSQVDMAKHIKKNMEEDMPI